MFGGFFSKKDKKNSTKDKDEIPDWDDSVDERISRLANKFEFSDDKSKGDMLKKAIDVLKHTSHRPTDKYDQLHIQNRLLAVMQTLAKNLPDGSEFNNLSYTLRSNWLAGLVHILDRQEFYLEQCQFDVNMQPRGPTSSVDIVLRYRKLLLLTLRGAIGLMQKTSFQGQMLRKVVNIFTRTYIRTRVLKIPLVGLVNELIISEDKAYEKVEEEKFKLREKRRKSIQAARMARLRRDMMFSGSLKHVDTDLDVSPGLPTPSPSAKSLMYDSGTLSIRSVDSSGITRLYGWEMEVQKLMSLTREAQRTENWEKYERKNPTLFLGYFFSEGTELREYLPDKSEKDHDKWLLKLVGHCGHYCVFLEQLILLVLKMSNPVADLDKVVWGVIPNFQRLLRLFCHVIMRVQQFDPDAPKLADTTESGLPASIAAEEKRRISDDVGPHARLYTHRRLQVQKSPQIVKAVKDCSVTLLENSDVNVFNLFLHALFSRTNVHNKDAVKRSLSWLRLWMERIPKEQIDITKKRESLSSQDTKPSKQDSLGKQDSGETLLTKAKRRVSKTSNFWGRLLGRSESISIYSVLPENLDYKYMFAGLRRLLLDEHHANLEEALSFIYMQLPRFIRKENRELALKRLVLEKKVFRHLFLYWHPLIRGLYHHILAYRVFFEEGRNKLKLRSDTYFLGNPNDSSSYQQVGKHSPKFKEKKKPKWVRRSNLEMGFELDDCFDPVIRAFKRMCNGESEKRPMKKHVYLKKSMKEYKNVLLGCYKRLLTRKDFNTVAPRLSHIKENLQNQAKSNSEGLDMPALLESFNKSESWSS